MTNDSLEDVAMISDLVDLLVPAEDSRRNGALNLEKRDLEGDDLEIMDEVPLGSWRGCWEGGGSGMVGSFAIASFSTMISVLLLVSLFAPLYCEGSPLTVLQCWMPFFI